MRREVTCTISVSSALHRQGAEAAHHRPRGSRRRHLVDSFLSCAARTGRWTGLHHSRLNRRSLDAQRMGGRTSPTRPVSRARPTTRKRPVKAAGAVDAKNAPTAPWKTGRPVSHKLPPALSSSLVTGTVLPMFPAG